MRRLARERLARFTDLAEQCHRVITRELLRNFGRALPRAGPAHRIGENLQAAVDVTGADTLYRLRLKAAGLETLVDVLGVRRQIRGKRAAGLGENELAHAIGISLIDADGA